MNILINVHIINTHFRFLQKRNWNVHDPMKVWSEREHLRWYL